jgi:hypothetical protein
VVRELEEAYGIEKSTVSEHFVEASRRHLEKLQRRHFGEDAFCAMMSGAGVLTKSALGTENVRDGLPLSPFRTIPRTDPRPLNRAVWPISPSKRAFFVNQKVGESFEVGFVWLRSHGEFEAALLRQAKPVPRADSVQKRLFQLSKIPHGTR